MYKVRIKANIAIFISLAFLFVSVGSVALVFAGFSSFKWLAYFLVPVGGVFVMTCALLAMMGKFDNDLKK